MTRTIDTQLALDLAKQYAEACYLLELQFSGATLRVTTAPRPVVANGNTYVSVGGLEVDGVGEVLDDRGQGLGLKLSGVSLAIIAQILTQQYRGRVGVLSYAHFAKTTNLCSNGDYEINTTGNAGMGATLSRSTAFSKHGGACLQVVTTNISGSGARIQDAAGLNGHPPVREGGKYIGSAWIKLNPVESFKDLRVSLEWFNGAGATLALDSTTTVQVRGGADFVRVETQVGTAPATAVGAALRIDTNGAQGVFTFFVDGAQLEPGEVAHEFQSTNAGPIAGGAIVGTPLEMFRGFMNSGFQVQEDRFSDGGGTATVSTRLVSRLAELSQVRGVVTNVDSHGRLFPGDTFFQHVPSLPGRRVFWGLKEPGGQAAAPTALPSQWRRTG